MIHHWFARIAIFAVCVCLARAVSAEVSVLVITPADDALDYTVYENRLRSELLAAGFSVVTERAPGRPSYASMAINAERSGSQASLAINVTDGELCGLLWISDPAKSGGLMRPVRCCPLNDDAPLVFAVRANDALSAGLLELNYPRRSRETPAAKSTEQTPAPPAKEQQPPKPTPAPAEKVKTPKAPEPAKPHPAPAAMAQRRWHVQGAAAVGAWLREFPVGYGGKLEVTRNIAESWAVGVHGFVLAPAMVSRAAGEADIFQFTAGPTLQYRTRLSPGLSLVDALGAGVYGISVSADALGPRGSRDASSLTGYVLFEHQIHIQASRTLSFVLGGAISAPFMRYSVIIVDATVARAAAPLVFGSLGVELSL